MNEKLFIFFHKIENESENSQNVENSLISDKSEVYEDDEDYNSNI